MTEEYISIDAWMGIDNTSEPVVRSIPQKGNGIYFSEIDNIDIDDNFKPHRRKGYGDRLISGSTRSLWAAPSGKISLYADGTNFKKLGVDFSTIPPTVSTTTLITGVNPTERFTYVEVGNYVYFSTISIVGYIDTRVGTSSTFSTPTQAFKVKMVGGQILEYHYNRLYVANGVNQFYSDAVVLSQMDSRKNAIAHPSRITMMKSVVDGMYLSDSERVYFQAGTGPDNFVSREVLDVPAIEGMSESGFIKRRKASVKAVYFVTKKGVYVGYPEGIVVHQQEGKFAMDNLEIGCAIIKNGTYQQFLAVGRLKAGVGDSSGEFRMPTMTMSGS
jgi:hypothetical protein